MGSSTSEVELAGGAVVTDPVRALQGLSQLASSPHPPLNAIRVILSSYHFDQSQENRKRSQETDLNHGTSKKARGGDHNAGWPCEVCSRSYSNKANLQRHVKSAHAPKRRLVVTDVFECEECDYTCATKAALETHMGTHASSSTDKSPKYKCKFCKKQVTSIYNHYQSQHKIEYPEQILFDDGDVLVRSDINTENGKAPWFLKEKEKLELYDNVTCRLCETETSFDNMEILVNAHYVMYHQVEPAMLDNIKRLFRAEKGAHLSGLHTSQTPKRKQCDTAMKEVSTRKQNTETHNHKATLKTQADESKLRVIFDCAECDQVYVTIELLDKHKKDKHGPKTEKGKSVKYKCTFCHKHVAGIYKHYGNVHAVEYPEQVLFFDRGRVLVRSDLDTGGGQAPWFIREKEKAENRYTVNTCRLCEIEYDNTDLLENHYLSEHKVEVDLLESLNNLRCLFRAEKGAHLVDLPASRAAKRQHPSPSQTSRPMSKTGSRSNEEKKPVIEEGAAGLIMYQCAECGVAASTCDASVEHAQLHHMTAGYNPIPLTCDICNFAFEAQCIADHSTHHLSKNEYKIVKFHPSKLLAEWSEMFEGLSESHANRIKASSIYQFTRKVKMNCDEIAGIPLYQCGKCTQYVRPKDVERHCYGKTSCVENQAPGHFCSDCERYFYTSAGLTDHEKDHKEYGNNWFRIVTFNCKEDETLSRDLQKLQRISVEESPVKMQEKKIEPIKIIENVTVSKFCPECKKYIMFSELDAHAATHNVNKNAPEHESDRSIDEEPQAQNCINNKDDEHSRGVAAQNAAVETEGNNVEGVVEQWNSDNDSCNSLQLASCTVHADVHVQKEIEDFDQSNRVAMANQNEGEIVGTGDAQRAGNSEVDVSSQLHNNITFDEFSEQMTRELRRDIQHLGFKEFGVDRNKWAYIPDDLTNNSLETLEHDASLNASSNYSDNTDKHAKDNISQDVFLFYEDVNQIAKADREISAVKFNAITRTRVGNVENNINVANTTANEVTHTNNTELSGAADKEDKANTAYDSVFQNNLEPKIRLGSRVILNRMLSDDESELSDAIEEKQ